MVATWGGLPWMPPPGETQWDGRGGFLFQGCTAAQPPTGFWRGADWIQLYQALDGTDLGIAFKRGQVPFLRGTPNPGHAGVQSFWTEWLHDSLNAGVDGI